MINPMLTNIGEPQRTIRDVPVPVPIRRRMVPIPKPKEPVKVPVKPKEPARTLWENIGLHVTEIPYYCPECGSEMDMEDGTLYCPIHGVVYE